MITEETILRDVPPIDRRRRPVLIAGACYARWMGSVDLIDDLDAYQLDPNGVVISRPDLFVLAKVVLDPHKDHRGELAWFIRMFVGDNMRALLAALPDYGIKRICFCRNNDGRMRSYDIGRLLHWSERKLSDNLQRRRTWAAAAA